MKCYYQSNYLAHHGVKGMKWGKRKAKPVPTGMRRRGGTDQNEGNTNSNPAEVAARRKKRAKTAALIGGSIVAAGLAAYGAYKISKIVKNKKMAAFEAEIRRRQQEHAEQNRIFNESVARLRKMSAHGSYERFGLKEVW